MKKGYTSDLNVKRSAQKTLKGSLLEADLRNQDLVREGCESLCVHRAAHNCGNREAYHFQGVLSAGSWKVRLKKECRIPRRPRL